MLTVTILCLAALVFAHDEEAEALIHPHKPHTPEAAIECGMKYADLNHDGGLSVAEVTVIRRLALGAVLNAGVSLLEHVPLIGQKITVEQIFRDCDANKDGLITMTDFEHMRATCLETKGKVDDVMAWVCQPGAKGAFANAKI